MDDAIHSTREVIHSECQGHTSKLTHGIRWSAMSPMFILCLLVFRRLSVRLNTCVAASDDGYIAPIHTTPTMARVCTPGWRRALLRFLGARSLTFAPVQKEA